MIDWYHSIELELEALFKEKEQMIQEAIYMWQKCTSSQKTVDQSVALINQKYREMVEEIRNNP